MKKTLLIVAIVVLALGVLGAGVAFAQGEQPPQLYGFGMTLAPGAHLPWRAVPGSAGMGGPGMMGSQGGYGFMHDSVEEALAEKLGLTEEQVEDALANGTTMYQLALDNGVAEADLPAFMNEVHQAAFDKAVADGVMTQEQADWMLEHMQGMVTNGYGFGDCPMNGEYPQDGTGFRGGMTLAPGAHLPWRAVPGSAGVGGFGGGRWQQTQP